MQISDLMTTGVETVSPESILRKAAGLMKELDIGAMPVEEEGRLIGFITDRDIAIRGVADGLDPNEATVREIMTLGVEFIYEDQDPREAAHVMEEKQVRRLAVMSRDQRLVGILSLGDLAVRNRDDALSGEALEKISEPAAV